ncbi:hypothetical protein PVAND_007397 [Polypedilum vanderplanki]|uniref:Uncharacterized protein n=1 Tax=Polypedilum vanderplanki TaxID=319348 RepID=A0A9J6C765_POLVA|nr:hypothetical protein PVAND_007397 [Polypedilum vanderplanki]
MQKKIILFITLFVCQKVLTTPLDEDTTLKRIKSEVPTTEKSTEGTTTEKTTEEPTTTGTITEEPITSSKTEPTTSSSSITFSTTASTTSSSLTSSTQRTSEKPTIPTTHQPDSTSTTTTIKPKPKSAPSCSQIYVVISCILAGLISILIFILALRFCGNSRPSSYVSLQ